MTHIFSEIRILYSRGLLHKKLLFRIGILGVISIILASIVVYKSLTREVDPLLAILLAIIGYTLGYFIFARINVVEWNEEKEIVQAGRMDLIAYITLGFYIAFEIGFRTLLKDIHPIWATELILASISGMFFGRCVWVIMAIHGVFNISSKK